MGEPTAPPVVQHLKPVMQSVSLAHAAPLPPSPVMHEVVAMVSTPAWWALHGSRYVLPSQPQTTIDRHEIPPTNRGMQTPVWSPDPQLPFPKAQ
jgi:hypothetical protein